MPVGSHARRATIDMTAFQSRIKWACPAFKLLPETLGTSRDIEDKVHVLAGTDKPAEQV